MKITKLSIIFRVVIYKILVWDLGMRVSGTVIFCCPQGWMSQRIFSRYWNPKEVSSNARKGMDFLAR